MKVTEVIASEVDAVPEQDCIDYMFALVIDRTFQGYETEIRTVYGQLEHLLDRKIEAAPDEWDRRYNVDFFIRVGERFIGLQIKPAGGTSHIPQIYKERQQQAETHRRFLDQYGGQVFYVISVKQGGQKVIQNPEVIEEIRAEIARLEQSADQ